MLGVLLIDKPQGITSHDVVREVRRRFGTRRVGHAGTLDPLATGLLVLAVGSATRFLQYLPLEPKVYRFAARFGTSTTTYDADGEPDGGGPVPARLEDKLSEHLPGFRGAIVQRPPLYSAVKHEGRPLYSYARKGEVAPREPRRVHVERLEMESVEGEVARFNVVCSGGTYIRTLAHDLGEKVGCGAHVVELERTSVGKFRLEDACRLEAASAARLIPLAEALPPMPLVELGEGLIARVRHGMPVRAAVPPVERVALTDGRGEVVGIARNDGAMLHPECVLPEVGHGAAV